MEKRQKIYRGEILIKTVTKDKKHEKHVYIKNSFVKDRILHINTNEAQLVLKYSIEDINQFKKDGKISHQEAESLKKELIMLDSQMGALQRWKKNNPMATSDDETKAFNAIIKKELEKTKMLKEKDFNIAIRKLIAQEELEKTSLLFKSINPLTHFGITKSIMDRLNHLPKLLDIAIAILISGEQWEIQSKCSNRGMGPIGLVHSFNASSKEEAKNYLDNYKKWMREEGLKTLTAYWKTACKKNKFNYSSSLTEIMTQNSDDARLSFFSVKEKQKFWANTRKLENTKLTIELQFPKIKHKKKRNLVIEHRLVDVGGRIQDKKEDSYPNNVIVKVLNSDEFQKQSQIATAIHNNTLKLPQKEILLALTIQTRQSQTKDKNVNEFDEDFLINRANLQQTAKTNKSKARSDLKKRLTKLKNENIINDFFSKESKQRTYKISSNPQKKKNT